jgi:hypothetical protein
MRWAGHVACMEEERKVYKALVGKAQRKEITQNTEAYKKGGLDQSGS